MPSFKIDFATVRELEKKTFRIFGYGGAAFALGLLLIMCGFAILGAPIMAVSALVLIGAMIWVSAMGKESHVPVFCPYCATQNDVYRSKRSFNCDICRRPIIINENGMALAAEHIDTQARYN